MKKIINFCLVFFIVFGFLTPRLEAHASYNYEKERIIVEVLVNRFDVSYLENIDLGDGTVVGDHDFLIIENPSSLFGSRSHDRLGYHFNTAAWITRDGVISLSLDPTRNVRTNQAARDRAWADLSSTRVGLGGHRNWNNTAAMRAQYNCHFTWATNKNRWNLEPHRTSTNIVWTALRGCNP